MTLHLKLWHFPAELSVTYASIHTWLQFNYSLDEQILLSHKFSQKCQQCYKFYILGIGYMTYIQWNISGEGTPMWWLLKESNLILMFNVFIRSSHV